MASKGKGRARQDLSVYAHALPISISPSMPTSLLSPSRFFHLAAVSNPHCVGIFDAGSRSVWVVNKQDRDLLWQRGFFGKGNLSRSEPSWLKRRINQLEAERGTNKGPTAEEITAQRRAERRHFKAERERAVAAAAAQAEALFQTEGKVPVAPAEHISTTVRANLAAQKKAAKTSTAGEAKETDVSSDKWLRPTMSLANVAARDGSPEAGPSTRVSPPEDAEDGDDAPEVEDLEHLQLTLQEAFFLAWSFGCLSVLDPKTDTYMSSQELWNASLFSSDSLPLIGLNTPPVARDFWSVTAEKHHLRFDNPFLINYVVYHHFRSLGWVVKSGIKFCVDYLLYKKGPVFSHAEFSIVIVPIYEDDEDEKGSPWEHQNTKPWSWSWLSTLNRVNTQVQKSLMIAYVTIPAMDRVDLSRLESPDIFEEYSVREVTVKRFVPARMRD